MTKVLFFNHRRFTKMAWDVSTPEQEEQAFLGLFQALDSIDFYELDTPGLLEAKRGVIFGFDELDDAIKAETIPGILKHDALKLLQSRTQVVNEVKYLEKKLDWLQKARGGDAEAAKKLLTYENEYVSKDWEILELQN